MNYLVLELSWLTFLPLGGNVIRRHPPGGQHHGTDVGLNRLPVRPEWTARVKKSAYQADEMISDKERLLSGVHQPAGDATGGEELGVPRRPITQRIALWHMASTAPLFTAQARASILDYVPILYCNACGGP